jgi:hypothetical protein
VFPQLPETGHEFMRVAARYRTADKLPSKSSYVVSRPDDIDLK